MFSFKHTALASVAVLGLSFGILGCQPERPDVVPSSAQMWNSGNGMLHYQAPADGTVYIFDHAQQRLIWSGKVWRGQSVDVDPQKGQIMAGGIVVVNKIAAPADQKDIYFDQAPVVPQPTDRSTTINNTYVNPAAPNNPNTSNGNGVLVTPNVTVQPSNGTSTNNGVTVQPGVTVTPAPSTGNP